VTLGINHVPSDGLGLLKLLELLFAPCPALTYLQRDPLGSNLISRISSPSTRHHPHLPQSRARRKRRIPIGRASLLRSTYRTLSSSPRPLSNRISSNPFGLMHKIQTLNPTLDHLLPGQPLACRQSTVGDDHGHHGSKRAPSGGPASSPILGELHDFHAYDNRRHLPLGRPLEHDHANPRRARGIQRP